MMNSEHIYEGHIHAFLQACKDLRILVIGDLMLDRYLWGQVERISPEAPVPVVDISKEENRLGGAANVALNVHALGARVALCGIVGQDADGGALRDLAEELGFDTRLMLSSARRRTTVKVRVIGNHQQVLRVDKEDRFPLSRAEKEQVLQPLLEAISGYDAIIFEDYDKSMLDPELIRRVVERARAEAIPVMVDPKFRHFWDYSDVTLYKPNMKELNEGLGLRLDKRDFDGITAAIADLRKRMPHQLSLITLSEHGMLLIDEQHHYHHLPAHYRDITDVSGAGDTVISVMGLGLAAGLSPLVAAYYANLAGGLVCEEVGVVPIDRNKLASEAEKMAIRK